MAVLPGSSGDMPEGGNDPSLGGVKWMEDVTEGSVRQNAYNQVFPSMQGAKESLLGNLLGGFFGVMTGIFTGAVSIIPSWFPSGAHQFAQQIRDGQRDLNDRTDLLSPLLDYCSVSSDPGSGEHRVSNNRFPFNYQIGPSQGVTIMGDGRIRLDDKGLWDLRAMITASWKVTNDQIQVFLRVLKPDGGLHSVYSEQGYYMKTSNNVTMTLVSSVVVPEPGYFVDMYIIGPGDRGYWVGPKWNRLTVQHISREVENGTGSEGSAEPTDPPEEAEPTEPTEPTE